MKLRDRQFSRFSLTKNQMLIGAVFCLMCIPLFAYGFWFVLLDFLIPEGAKIYLVGIGMATYIGRNARVIPTNIERAQKFCGAYTRESFPAGLYINVGLPFPMIELAVLVIFEMDVSEVLGWKMDGDLRVESIVIPISAEGITFSEDGEGARARIEGVAVFDLTVVAKLLSQGWNGTNKVAIIKALGAHVANALKRTVIPNSNLVQLHRGEYDNGATIADWVAQECNFEEDFGVMLDSLSIVTVTILDERVRAAFDTNSAKDLLMKQNLALAKSFRKFHKRISKGVVGGVSEEAALMLFNADQTKNGNPGLNMNVFKVR